VVFRQSTLDQMNALAKSFPWTSSVGQSEFFMSGDASWVKRKTIDGDPFELRLEVTGICRATWERAGNDWDTLIGLVESAVSMHRRLVQDVLGYGGDVVVAAANAWDQGRVKIVSETTPIHALDSDQFKKAMDRALTREVGYLSYEPEAD
jgi:hypothetical protein